MQASKSSTPKKKAAPKQGNKQAVSQVARPPAPFRDVAKEEMVSPGQIEANLEFEKRLLELEKNSQEQKAKLKMDQQAASDILQPNYDNPPPLTSTLFADTNTSSGAPKTSLAEASSFGPSQVVLGALSLVLVGVFLIANGGSDLGYATKSPSSQQSTLAPEQRKDLESELKIMQEKLDQNPGDLEALESSAVLNTQLGDYQKASEQLEKLAIAKPDDQEILRLLGETYSVQGNSGKAADTFRKAFKASDSRSLEILTLLTDTLMQSGKQKDAIAQVQSLKQKGSDGLADVELGMLEAKLYAQWRGHIPDAFAVYEKLCEDNPDDFRPFLGRGLLLKSEGRMADAQRMFVQARYLAPPSSKATVEALIKNQG